jgi:hypothetical protein
MIAQSADPFDHDIDLIANGHRANSKTRTTTFSISVIGTLIII